MIITTDLIKSLNPCKDRLDNFLTQYGHYWQGTHREFAALVYITYEDIRWVLDRIYRQNFGFKPSFGMLLETILSALDNCDKQEAAKAKDVFQVGDIVEWCGVSGVVITSKSTKDYPIECNFKGSVRPLAFTSDGRYYDWQEPSLKLIERPKKKIKMYKVLFKMLEYINQFQVSGDHYADKEDFESRNYSKQFIQLIKESEIEVDG